MPEHMRWRCPLCNRCISLRNHQVSISFAQPHVRSVRLIYICVFFSVLVFEVHRPLDQPLCAVQMELPSYHYHFAADRRRRLAPAFAPSTSTVTSTATAR